MGIVIINGQRYDAKTGLMMSDDGGDTSHASTKHVGSSHSQVVANTSAEHTPKPINNARGSSVVNRKAGISARQAMRAQPTKHTTSTASRTTPAARRRVIQAATPRWISNYVAGGEPLEVKPITKSEAEFRRLARDGKPLSTRRQMGVSRTLNRRFVRKPTDESDEKIYREPLVESQQHEIPVNNSKSQKVTVSTTSPDSQTTRQQMEQSKQSVRVNNIKIITPASEGQVETPDEPFQPMLTRRQAEHVAARTPVAIPVNSDTQPSKSFKLSGQASQIGDRLSMLGQVLENNQATYDNESADDDVILDNVHNILNESGSNRKLRSHKSSTSRKRRRFRAPAIATVALALAIVAGYASYLAMPSISVKIAANNAGVDAKNPYAPDGYTINGPVAYESGRVTINYKGHSTSGNYSITQENSNLSDNDIKATANAKSGGTYEAINGKNATVYLYNGKAVWLKDGILNTISTNDYLDSNQILKIANSL